HPGCSEQVRCAKTHLARAQLDFAELRQTFGWGESIGGRLWQRCPNWFAKTRAEQGDDLLNLHDLLRRRENEGRQALPRILPQQPEAHATPGPPAELFQGRKTPP